MHNTELLCSNFVSFLHKGLYVINNSSLLHPYYGQPKMYCFMMIIPRVVHTNMELLRSREALTVCAKMYVNVRMALNIRFHLLGGRRAFYIAVNKMICSRETHFLQTTYKKIHSKVCVLVHSLTEGYNGDLIEMTCNLKIHCITHCHKMCIL